MVWKFMKFGFRKPSLKKSIKARTTGKLKRKAKKAVKNPKKAVYNKVYHRTSFSIFGFFKKRSKK